MTGAGRKVRLKPAALATERMMIFIIYQAPIQVMTFTKSAQKKANAAKL